LFPFSGNEGVLRWDALVFARKTRLLQEPGLLFCDPRIDADRGCYATRSYAKRRIFVTSRPSIRISRVESVRRGECRSPSL
jgi:hypothetical protein